jgi:formate dehydrogenase iron-sulfur subunit
VSAAAPVKVYVPRDAAALSVGAQATAQAIVAEAQRRGVPLELIRNGSRGLLSFEPLVEVATPAGRVAYGPVAAGAVAGLFEAGFLHGRPHPLAHGRTEEMGYLKNQERLTFARVGITDPRSLADYLAHGGYRGLRAALGMAPAAIVAAVTASGLRGRGGAAFPAGIKWRTVLGAPGAQKYIVCNADEGDSGTFSDRMLMEGDPFVLIEGMTIAGLACGATRGYIYLRWEYPHAQVALAAAIAAARAAHYLGEDIQGSGTRFELEVRVGAGAYIWKASAGRCASSRRCRRSRGCSASRRSSTTSLLSPRCRSFWTRAPSPISTSAWAARAARCRCSWPATSSAAGWWRRPSG